MSMQSMTTAPARNAFKAAGKPSKISLGKGHPSTVKPNDPPIGKKLGSPIPGASGGVKAGKIKV